jgi:glycosyltransferase involved in cell wall biosynthesis
MITRTQVQISRRYRQLRDIWKAEGRSGITDRIREAGAEALAPKNPVSPVRHAEVIAADLSHPYQHAIPAITSGSPLVVNWVTTPPSPSSGGHTTLFRMIRYLEAHGYRNRVYFYDVYRGDHSYYESIVRNYYGFHGSVGNVDQGMEDAHAVFATGWPTAYPVFNDRCAGKRFYFVQDYEPYFHPVGALSLLAENTYRMGFHAITAGRWLATKLSSEFGMKADSFEFGCDTSIYHREPKTKRSGLVFYARPEAARRGFEIGITAMEIFARKRPDVDLHFYGNTMKKLPFRIIDHGRVNPIELNQIYNQCFAGLSLSLTNVSLVPHEMLAAGCIPVVNEAIQNRIVLDNPFVRYVAPTPHALASELEAVVTNPEFDSLSSAAASSVTSSTWDDAGAAVDAALQRSLKAMAEATAS